MRYGADFVEAVTRTDRREELARASYELIAELGVDGASLRGVARRLGATTGLVSHHFSNRAELIEAALDHAVRVCRERFVPTDRRVELIDVLEAVLPTEPSTETVWRFSFSVRTAALFDPELRRFDASIRAIWDDNLPRALRPVVGARARDVATQLVALIDGIALQAVVDPDRWPADRQRAVLRAAYRDLVNQGEP